MKKFIAVVMTLAICLSMTSALAASGEAMVSWYTFGDVYLSSVREALDEALAAKGFTVNDKDANGIQQTQTDDVSTAAVSGTSVILINMVESGSFDIAQNLMNSATTYGVPVVFFNRAVYQEGGEAEAAELFTGNNSAFVGTNFVEAGMMQGDMIGEYVLANYDALDLNGDGVISYVMFMGDLANQEAIARTKYGVENADAILTAAGKPALKFYDEANSDKYLLDQNGTWSQVASNDHMNTVLSMYNAANNNMIELVIANNDDMAIGAINALTVVGYNTGIDGDPVIPVFGVDATAAAQEMIAAGRMTGTVKQDAVGMAEAVATIAANLAEGNELFAGLNENFNIVDGWTVNIPYSKYTGE